jgi:hypothetical protein
LLGTKVITLNKIKGTQTIGSKSCSLLETGASYFLRLETSIYQLKPKPIKPVITSPAASEPPKSLLKSTAKKSAAAWCLTKKAEPPPTRGVNRDSGTASANGGWLRRLVRPLATIYKHKI